MATFYACHFCKQIFPTIDILRVHDHSPCPQFAEYRINKMKSSNQEVTNQFPPDCIPHSICLQLEMAHAFFYLSCTSCGLWLAIRSQYSNLNMRNKAWNFFKCSCVSQLILKFERVLFVCWRERNFNFYSRKTFELSEAKSENKNEKCRGWSFWSLIIHENLPYGLDMWKY